MELDKEFIKEILNPLEKAISLTPLEYFKELEKQGTIVENEFEVIDEKFHRHFEYAIEKGMITNSNGIPTLKACGFRLSGNGSILIVGNSNFLKAAKPMDNEKSDSVTNFHFNGNFSGNLQSGESNTINTTTIQHLIKELEKSNDPMAKKLLDNVYAVVSHPIVQNILSNV